MDKNSLGYLRLAILRNEKLNAMNYVGLENDRLVWMEYNKELIRIESGMLQSLKSMKEEGRATLFTNIIEAQKHAEFEICRLNMARDPKVPSSSSLLRDQEDSLKALSDATRVKEATDYLELVLQINYPQEFPNPLVEEVLSYVNAKNARDPEGPEDSIPPAYSTTYTQMVMGLANDGKIEQDDITGAKQEVVNFHPTLKEDDTFPQTDFSAELNLTEYQPSVISLFERYKASQLHGSNNTPYPSEQEVGNPIFEDGGQSQS